MFDGLIGGEVSRVQNIPACLPIFQQQYLFWILIRKYLDFATCSDIPIAAFGHSMGEVNPFFAKASEILFDRVSNHIEFRYRVQTSHRFLSASLFATV